MQSVNLGGLDYGKSVVGQTSVVKEKNTLNNSINFKSQPKADMFEKTIQQDKAPVKKISTSRKLGSALASMICPGLGQAANGHFMKALGIAVVGPIAIAAATTALMTVSAPAALAVSIVSGVGLYAYNLIDAYKNAGK